MAGDGEEIGVATEVSRYDAEDEGVQTAIEMYGRLKEAVHMVGYSFERVSDMIEWLLEGVRWQLGGRFTNVDDFVDSIKLNEFRLLTEQRKRIAKRIKALQPTVTNVAIAKALGVNEGTVRLDLGVKKQSDKSEPECNPTAAINNLGVSKSDKSEVPTPAVPKSIAMDGDAARRLSKKQADKADKAAERREERLDKIAEISKGNAELSVAVRYPVIYADPPWRYENPPMGDGNRSIENHYPTMALEEICALPVRELATEDAILFMWATAPKLAECLKVLDAWGFVYRTNLVWDKEVIGMGYYARNQHELLLIARRGNIPTPAAGKQPSSVHRERRGEHSAKPAFYYEMIEAAYPQLPKIELFCRSPRAGWSAWGNQAEAGHVSDAA